MKIGIEAQRIFRNNPHGMDIFAIELINRLVHLDTIEQIVVFVNSEVIKEGVLVRHPKISVVVESSHYAMWEQLLLPKMIRRFDLDLIHFTSNTRSLKIDIPTVTTLHDIIFLDQYPLFRKGYSLYQRFGNLYRRFIVKRMLSTNGAIVTVSNSEAERIKKRSNRAEVPFVYNGIASCFKIASQREVNTFLEQWRIEEPYVLFLGNTDPKKNTRRILKAFETVAESLPDVQFVIADYKEEDFVKTLGPNANKLISRVKFLGYVDQKDLVYLYNGASAFVYCSLAESFGIPVAEAFTCNTPVLASTIPAIIEISAEGAHLVDPNDKEKIVEGLVRILSDTEYREHLQRKGAEVAQRYNWQNTAKEYVKIYESVC